MHVCLAGGQMQGTVNENGVESLQREMQALRLQLKEKEGQVEKLVSCVACFKGDAKQRCTQA